LIDVYFGQKAENQLIDLLACEQQRAMQRDDDCTKYLVDWEVFVPQGYWPDRLLPICQHGCGLYYYLDLPTDRVFHAGCDYLALRLVANSLEELFERWMQDDLFKY
jgi:hypothetical protein